MNSRRQGFRSLLLLDKSMGEGLFRFSTGDTLAINVMGHLVNQNVIQVEPAQVIKGSGNGRSRYCCRGKPIEMFAVS